MIVLAVVNFVNYASKGQSRGGMGAVMKYVMQDEKTEWEERQLVTGVNCQAQSAYDDFLNTKLLYNKDGGRMFYHLVQSFPKDAEVDPDTAHTAALRLAEQLKDHEVLVCTHTDREHVHSHLIINSVNFETGKKLHVDGDMIDELKMVNDKICSEMGLPVFEPQPKQKVRGMGTREYRSAEKGESWKFRLMNTIDECMKYASTRDEFIALMRSEGYDVKWTDTRKNITYTTPAGMKCRDDRLHEEKYLKEYMENEFTIRQTQVPGGAESGEQNESFESDGDTTLRDSNRAELEGGHLSPLWDSPASGSGRGRPKKHSDEERRGGSTETDRRNHAGSPLESAIGGAEVHRTGWEDEREFFLRRREAGYEYGEEPVFDDGVYGTASEQSNLDSGAMDAENSFGGNSLGGITNDLIRLGYAAAGIVNDAPVQDTTTIPHHTDSKQRRKEQRKRIAMGHKPDDHERQQTWQQTMY